MPDDGFGQGQGMIEGSDEINVTFESHDGVVPLGEVVDLVGETPFAPEIGLGAWFPESRMSFILANTVKC